MADMLYQRYATDLEQGYTLLHKPQATLAVLDRIWEDEFESICIRW